MRHARTHGLASLADRLPALRAHRFGGGEGTDGTDSTADVLAAIREAARSVHERLAHDEGVFAAEFLGATGSGKTALVERLLARRDPDTVGVVAGDVAGTDDADRYRDHGVAVADVTTGKDCHLDPERVETALAEFDLAGLETVFVENVGNMVCPADFPLGAHLRVVVVSPTEGDDVVRKHPLLFQACDATVVNKVDIADAVGASVDRMVADLERVAPETPVVRTSARTGRGVDELERLLADHDHEHTHVEPGA
jgi:hydrogenase nickel incorporation protein HypB